ncbi:MAG: ABC transporter permease [Thermomicrobiales bacterium]|nr:ABC transporter permease [Thermomicrobiales bacterium]
MRNASIAADIQTLATGELQPPRSSSRFWTRLRSERKVLIGLVLLGAFAILAIIGPWISPYGPDDNDFGLLVEPSWRHPMGTDSYGRDLFSRVLIGTRVSFSVGLLAALLALVVGGIGGMIAGFYGGKIDSVIMRFVELLWSFPVIVLAVGMVAFFGAGFRNVVVAIAVAYIDDFARIIRAEVLTLREQDFSLAARAIGARDRRILSRHLLPNMVAPIIVQFTFAVGLGILTESTLTYLGLGVNPSTPTWGLALNEGRDFIRQAWWISVFPGLAIVTTVLALNLFGDGLRDALEVRSVSESR